MSIGRSFLNELTILVMVQSDCRNLLGCGAISINGAAYSVVSIGIILALLIVVNLRMRFRPLDIDFLTSSSIYSLGHMTGRVRSLNPNS